MKHRPRRILCLGAHADDIEIGCGGTLLHYVADAEDVSVKWVVLSGNATRQAEARQSATQFLAGAAKTEIITADFPDGFFPEQWGTIKRFFETDLKPFKPDLIFTHFRHDRHQDHRIISDLTWNTFRNHFILEYEILKYDGDLGRPNVFVPLADEIVQLKIDLLMSGFPTQTGKHWFTPDAFRSLLRIRGIEAATPFAEAFHGRKLTLSI